MIAIIPGTDDRHARSTDRHRPESPILNEAFRSHGLRYQDAPDLCSLKLHREMANSVDDPLKTHYRISGTELDNYRDSHSPKAAKALYPRKVVQDYCRRHSLSPFRV